MRSAMLKGLAMALVAAAVLVPAAAPATSHHSTVKWFLLPLPKSKLGSAAAGLKFAGGGRVRNYSSEQGKRGRVTGAQLDYGYLFLANPGLDAVDTRVDEYTTARKAKHEMPFWKKDWKKWFSSSGLFYAKHLTQLNVTATESSLSVPAIGDRHWAEMVTVSVQNYGSVYVVLEGFCDGKYVLDLAVAAGSQDLATSYAASKARVLDRRLHLWLNGRLHGHRIASPKHPTPGPPANGPDPKTAVLQASDLPGSTAHGSYGYVDGHGILSSYGVSFDPAGSFYAADQAVFVMSSSNSAGFFAPFLGARLLAQASNDAPDSTVTTPVDVSAVGDEAQAVIASIPAGTETAYVAVITLHSGPLADVVFAERVNATIAASDVQTLAQAAANRLDAALP